MRWEVTQLLDRPAARRVATRARVMVGERYSWATIADDTAAVYAATIDEAPGFSAVQANATMEHGRPQTVVPDGNLLAL